MTFGLACDRDGYDLRFSPNKDCGSSRGSNGLNCHEQQGIGSDTSAAAHELQGRAAPGDRKATNPKDAVGIKKVGLSVLPIRVMYEVALGMLEGALKYGRHNYRVIGVRASVYYDATKRHLDDWWEGEDIDPASQLNHVTKAISSLTVLRDAMIRGNWVDDRPPRSEPGWIDGLNAKAAALIDKYPKPMPAYVQAGAVSRGKE
ncbi:dATP/dGTP diphosphohydrolase domain-containing protein [Bradyrhizobium sp. SZCCHNR3118]|uniref:dATP/dGTP diphosphohydrolase domain-containing protein n=1 Tax=Bradyrhizobium sp. SZCCHNR3118 TaxID=3057468 RepID=UPI0029165D34|nr:dATP/dGTP diphosphohydrolase domain-containing protein [Bradyrhizobium sp. SZCCHNR3118]